MRRWDRIVLIAGLVALAPVLAGCENFDFDKLDVFNLNQKKKLPGERHPVFPAGVPGVSQGIPPEYLRENQPPPATADVLPPQQGNPQAAVPPNAGAGERPSKTAAVEPLQTSPQPQAEPKPKPKPKPKAKAKPKPKPEAAPTAVTVRRAPQQPAAQEQQPAPPPWPGTAAAQPPAQQSPWNTGQTAPAPWPAAPPPGTFSR
jgi:hypothetical protein